MVRILAQAIDAAVGAERELVLRKELGAAGQRRQQAADLLQGGVGDAALLDLARPRRPAAARPWRALDAGSLGPPFGRSIARPWRSGACRPAATTNYGGEMKQIVPVVLLGAATMLAATAPGADRDQAAAKPARSRRHGGRRQPTARPPRPAAGPSHHRPAPAGLRAAAGGDRARRDRRHRPTCPRCSTTTRARRYRRIFQAQAAGQFAQADAEIARLEGQDPDGLCRRPAPARALAMPRATTSSPPGCRNTTTIPMRRRSTSWRWPAARPARSS